MHLRKRIQKYSRGSLFPLSPGAYIGLKNGFHYVGKNRVINRKVESNRETRNGRSVSVLRRETFEYYFEVTVRRLNCRNIWFTQLGNRVPLLSKLASNFCGIHRIYPREHKHAPRECYEERKRMFLPVFHLLKWECEITHQNPFLKRNSDKCGGNLSVKHRSVWQIRHSEALLSAQAELSANK